MLYMAIQLVCNKIISYKFIFHPFQLKILFRILFLYILQILIYLPFGFFIAASAYIYQTESDFAIPAATLLFLISTSMLIYISVRLSLSIGLILTEEISPWQAIVKSFKATRANFWRILAVFLIEILIIILGLIPFGIGLIWTLPFALTCYGVIYQRLIGVPKNK
jgi:uncharacterized membrane protein